MDLKEVGLLANKKWNQTIKKGYDQMNVYLKIYRIMKNSGWKNLAGKEL